MIVVVAGSFLLASCGKENPENPEVDPYAFKAVKVQYSFEVSDDYLAFYDIFVVYAIDNGVGSKERLETNTWSMSFEYGNGVTVMPKSLFYEVVATPKAETPAIDPAKVYQLGDKWSGVRCGGY